VVAVVTDLRRDCWSCCPADQDVLRKKATGPVPGLSPLPAAGRFRLVLYWRSGLWFLYKVLGTPGSLAAMTRGRVDVRQLSMLWEGIVGAGLGRAAVRWAELI